ncbi:MAG: restriction endonuclease subunit S [Methanobrevibacter sp.]
MLLYIKKIFIYILINDLLNFNEQTLKYYVQVLLKNREYSYYNEYKLKDILINKSSNLKINELNENNGIYPLYGANGFLKNIDFCEQKQDYIAIVKDGSGVGNLFLFNKNSSIVGTMEYLIPKNGFNIFYIYYLLKTMNLNKYKIGSSIPHIYFKDYSKEKVKIPPLNMQMSIGTLLNNIKIKSNIINTKIKYLKNFKNGLMQKMFI